MLHSFRPREQETSVLFHSNFLLNFLLNSVIRHVSLSLLHPLDSWLFPLSKVRWRQVTQKIFPHFNLPLPNSQTGGDTSCVRSERRKLCCSAPLSLCPLCCLPLCPELSCQTPEPWRQRWRDGRLRHWGWHLWAPACLWCLCLPASLSLDRARWGVLPDWGSVCSPTALQDDVSCLDSAVLKPRASKAKSNELLNHQTAI